MTTCAVDATELLRCAGRETVRPDLPRMTRQPLKVRLPALANEAVVPKRPRTAHTHFRTVRCTASLPSNPDGVRGAALSKGVRPPFLGAYRIHNQPCQNQRAEPCLRASPVCARWHAVSVFESLSSLSREVRPGTCAGQRQQQHQAACYSL